MPENVPENTPGAWLTKLSMIAPGLREREGVLQLLAVLAVQFVSGQGAAGLGLLGELGPADVDCWERRRPSWRGEGQGGVLQCLEAEAGYMRGTEWPEEEGLKAAGLDGSVVCGWCG